MRTDGIVNDGAASPQSSPDSEYDMEQSTENDPVREKDPHRDDTRLLYHAALSFMEAIEAKCQITPKLP